MAALPDHNATGRPASTAFHQQRISEEQKQSISLQSMTKTHATAALSGQNAAVAIGEHSILCPRWPEEAPRQHYEGKSIVLAATFPIRRMGF